MNIFLAIFQQKKKRKKQINLFNLLHTYLIIIAFEISFMKTTKE